MGLLLFLMVLSLTTWRLFIYPWANNWGATKAERIMPLPGDEFVPNPTSQSTYGITIWAPAADAWKWLVQIGQDRGGFYSYSFLENRFGADIHNTNEIKPEWRERRAGDIVRLAPPDWFGGWAKALTQLEVLLVEPNHALYLKGWGAFVLIPAADSSSCRFLIRIRVMEEPRTRFLMSVLFDPEHFLMQRRMMMSIKQLAEAGPAAPKPVIPSRSDYLWFLSVAGSGFLILMMLLVRRKIGSLLTAVALTILLTFVLFRLPPIPLYGIGLAVVTAIMLIWVTLPSDRKT
jgi:hypothetical protein